MATQLESTIGLPARDLPLDQAIAFQHGHDADFPTENSAQVLHPMDESHNKHTSLPARSEFSVSTEGRNPSLEKDLEKSEPNVATNEVADPNLVDWDGPDDPANPLNWGAWIKGVNLVILSVMTLITPLASSMFAPGVPQLMSDFGSDSTLLATFVVSVYLLGFAAGPLVIAPFSELYGRLVVYHTCNVGFIAFTLACAYAPTLPALIGFRFLQGCWGVAPLTIGGGTIVDLVPAERRGRMMSLWSIGPLIGPVIGPVAGGFLATAAGWRWIFKLLAITSGVVTILAFIFLRETYPTILLGRKAERLRKETGNLNLRSKYDMGLTPKVLFLRSIVRPTKMLLLAPICSITSLYMAIIYSFLYLLFTTFTYVFEERYHFSTSTVGLVYIGSGIGFFIGLGVMGFFSDSILQYLAKKHGGGIKPEYRLPPLIYSAPLLPIAFFIYGWTTQYEVHWIVPIFGTLLLGIGMNIAFMGLCTYMVDTFTIYAASAMAANTVLRSIFGGVIPLFGLKLYDALGLGWGNSLLGFVSLALCPIAWLLYVHGEKIRTNERFQVKF